MRMTFAAPALALLLGLSACGSSLVTPDFHDPTEPPAVCAEQSQMATWGRRDGREIRITCP